MKVNQILEKKESLRDRLTKKHGITKFSGSTGLNEKTGTWYGWSHRAIYGFKVGDKIFEANFGDDKTHFSKHGKKPIKTLDDAKLAAERFSEYVS
jgi:hypothetical protein